MKFDTFFSKFIVPLVFAFYVTSNAQAASGDLLFTLTAPPTYENDQFGAEIATTLDGDIVVGSIWSNVDGIFAAGAVYIYDGDTGALIRTIDNPTPGTLDQFGADVEIMPNSNLLVTEANANASDPAVHVFDVNTGALILSLAPNINIADNGDFIAATPDNNIVVSSVYDSGGTVFLFDGTTGEVLLQISNPSGDVSGGFGASVISTAEGNLLISTSSNDNVNAVYLYNGKTGDLLLTIPPPNGQWRPSLAIIPDGNFVIGDRYDPFIHIFDGTTGALLQTVESPDSAKTQNFGWDIEITPDGDILVSNEYFDPASTFPDGIGLAHLFDGTTGALLLTLEAPDPEIAANTPQVATTPDGKLIVSVPYDPLNFEGIFLGEVYVFEGPQQDSCASSGFPLDTICDVITKLQSIADENSGTPLADRLEDSISDLETAIVKLSRNPPNYKAGLRFLRLATIDIESAVNDGLLDDGFGDSVMDVITGIARQITTNAIAQADANGADLTALTEAKELLVKGDKRRAAGNYVNAIWQYRKAIIAINDFLS